MKTIELISEETLKNILYKTSEGRIKDTETIKKLLLIDCDENDVVRGALLLDLVKKIIESASHSWDETYEIYAKNLVNNLDKEAYSLHTIFRRVCDLQYKEKINQAFRFSHYSAGNLNKICDLIRENYFFEWEEQDLDELLSLSETNMQQILDLAKFRHCQTDSTLIQKCVHILKLREDAKLYDILLRCFPKDGEDVNYLVDKLFRTVSKKGPEIEKKMSRILDYQDKVLNYLDEDEELKHFCDTTVAKDFAMSFDNSVEKGKEKETDFELALKLMWVEENDDFAYMLTDVISDISDIKRDALVTLFDQRETSFTYENIQKVLNTNEDEQELRMLLGEIEKDYYEEISDDAEDVSHFFTDEIDDEPADNLREEIQNIDEIISMLKQANSLGDFANILNVYKESNEDKGKSPYQRK